MGLFATIPVDEVTVQDIASSVEMTPAAVYYHFASKEHILVEGMELFRDGLIEQVCENLPDKDDEAGIRTLFANTMKWASERKTPALVYFVSSIGLNLMVEAVRRETRLRLIEELRPAVKAVRGSLPRAEVGVICVALVSLLETALASMLTEDAAYRGLGVKKFSLEVGAIADRLAGVSS